MARELGDHTSLARLRAAAEREYDPRFFGDGNEMFGWWFGLNEAFPRGQRSASMMVAEVGDGDAWNRAFEAPHLDKYEAPTVEGVDFPALGIYQAWNDTASGALHVGTYAAAPDRRGTETRWRVTNLPDSDDVFILCDGAPFQRYSVDGPDAIRIDGTVDLRHYQIFTGYRGPGTQAGQGRRRDRAAGIGERRRGGARGRERPSRPRAPAGRPPGRHHQLLRGRTDLSLLSGIAGSAGRAHPLASGRQHGDSPASPCAKGRDSRAERQERRAGDTGSDASDSEIEGMRSGSSHSRRTKNPDTTLESIREAPAAYSTSSSPSRR